MLPIRAAGALGKFFYQRLEPVLVLFQRFNSPLSPLYWAGQGLVSLVRELAQGNWLFSGYGFCRRRHICGFPGDCREIILLGWASMQARDKSKTPSTGEKRDFAAQNRCVRATYLAKRPWAVTIKDWTVIRRDIRNMSQLITPLIFGSFMRSCFCGRKPGAAGRGEAPAGSWI